MFSLRTQEIILLVKDRFEDLLGARVHVMTVRPDENEGWAVYIESWRDRLETKHVA